MKSNNRASLFVQADRGVHQIKKDMYLSEIVDLMDCGYDLIFSCDDDLKQFEKYCYDNGVW